MRVATWNIHGWKTADNKPNLIAVGDTLAAIQPDIIGLNEVFYPRIAEGSSKPALEALAERLGMNFIFGPCLRWQVQDNMPADAYGNAILSRWPIIASSAHQNSVVCSKGASFCPTSRPLHSMSPISTTPTKRRVWYNCAWHAPGCNVTATVLIC